LFNPLSANLTKCYTTANAKTVLVLVPMFLILSSSIYPAIIGHFENRDVAIMAKVMAQIDANRVDTSGHHANLLPHNSPTPIALSPISPLIIEDKTASRHSANSSISSPQANTTLMTSDSDVDEDTVHAAAEGNLVIVVWEDTTPGPTSILERRSLNAGSTFPNVINNIGGGFSPDIAVSDFTASDIVHVVWEGQVPGEIFPEILYSRSLDGGATFGPIINLSNTPGVSFAPKVAVFNNIVHVVWQDTTPGNQFTPPNIFYKRSTDAGATFPNVFKNLSGNVGDSTSPSIAVSGTNGKDVHVVWDDNTNSPPESPDILYRKSSNSGATFPNVIKNLSGNAGSSVDPAIAVFGSAVHVAWTDNTFGIPDILYRRSLNGGVTFPNIIKNISGSGGGAAAGAEIAVLGDNVHIVWSEAGVGILYRKSLNGGTTFPNIIKNISGSGGAPAIAVFGITLHIVWHDITTGNFEVFYKRSLDNGDTFPNTVKNLSSNSGSSGGARVAVL
jgi:hypothetical protein